MTPDTTIESDRSHGHLRIVAHTASGRVLDDLSRPHLWDAQMREIWDTNYKHCTVGTFHCTGCPDDGPARHQYLKIVNNQRITASIPAHVLRKHVPVSDEHQALKDRIAALADERGLCAAFEVGSDTRKRITDVIVSGGVAPVGWEIQLSELASDNLRHRIQTAVSDGLAPVWLSMNSRPVVSRIIDRAPAGTVRDMLGEEVRIAGDPMIMRGVKIIVIEPCDREYTRLHWHGKLKCSGVHGRPDMSPGQPSLGGLIEDTAAGTVVPYEWPRRDSQGRKFWILAPKQDVARFLDAEQPFFARSNTILPPMHGLVTMTKPWHSATTRVEPVDMGGYTAITDNASTAILGPKCPGCGWRRGQHRPPSIGGCFYAV